MGILKYSGFIFFLYLGHMSDTREGDLVIMVISMESPEDLPVDLGLFGSQVNCVYCSFGFTDSARHNHNIL